MTQKVITGLKQHWPVWLVLMAVALQPFGRSVEIAILFMALFALIDLFKNRNALRTQKAFRLFTLLFLCFWIPALLSLPDAVNISKSSATAFGMLRFYFAGVFVISRIANPLYIKWLAAGIGCTALFWGLDGLLQVATGVDILGREMVSGRATGIFGDKLRAGWMLVPLAGVAILYFARYQKYWLVGLAAMAILGTIVVSGDRGAWVGVFWASIALFFMLFISGKRPTKRIALLTVSVMALGIVLVSQIPNVQQRLAYTKTVFQGDYEAWDHATSRRLTLWNSALEMVEDNLLNGVGVRGFRYAYPVYAPEGDIFVRGVEGEQTGAHHAHQIVIEVLSDAGLPGLFGYLLAIVLFIGLIREAVRRQGYLALGYLASVVGVLMPLNSHLSLYSSYWSQAYWILFALTVATVFYERKEA